MATRLYWRSTAADLGGTWLDMVTTQGSSAVTRSLRLVAGGSEVGPWTTVVDGATIMEWISGYSSASWTLSGTITFRGRFGSSGAASNYGPRLKLWKRSSAGAETLIGTFNYGSETSGTLTNVQWTGSPTSTAFAANDRLVLRVYAEPQGGTMGTNRADMVHDASGTGGNAYVELTEDVTFDAVPSGPTTHDQALSAAITATASIVKVVGKRLSAAATMTAALARIAVFPLVMLATMTLSASMRREIAKFLSASLTGTASILKLVGKGLSAGFNLTGLITKAFPLALSASMSLSASIQRTITKSLVAAIGLTGALQRIKVAVVSMSASVTLTASMLAPALFSRALTASIDLSASMRRTIAKNLSVALPAIAKPLRWVAQQYAAFRNDKPNWNQCPRCSRRVRPNQMHRQMEYRGPRLVWTGLYVCKSCIDEPQPQEIWPRKTGGDPRPVLLARPRRD